MINFDYTNLDVDVENRALAGGKGNDLALFAIWKDAQPFISEIRDLIERDFSIIMESEVVWSERNFHRNASRLYEAPIYSPFASGDTPDYLNHAKKIGAKSFTVFVVKDHNPDYSYETSVSGKIEVSNVNVVRSKRELRSNIFDKTGSPYAIHSTNSIFEFYYQAPLLFGVDLFKDLVSGFVLGRKRVVKDLEGADGWNSWSDVIEMLNLTNEYCILRGFEDLPLNNLEKDLDLLCRNYQKLASTLNVIQVKGAPYKGIFRVSEENVSIDMRFVGDKYYDASFQNDILLKKVKINGLYRPSVDLYFFSLLYHCKVHKLEVKKKYKTILSNLAVELDFKWFKPEHLHNNHAIGPIIGGFYESNHYMFELPVDSDVISNHDVIRYLPNVDAVTKKIGFIMKLKRWLLKFMPQWIIRVLKVIFS